MAENGDVYVAVPQLRQAVGDKKKPAAETFLAEVPQVLKPLPSQGSDKHRILSSLLHSLRRSSFSPALFALSVTTVEAREAIYQNAVEAFD